MISAVASEPREESWEDIYLSMADHLVHLGRTRYGLNEEDCEDALQKTATDVLLNLGAVQNRRGFFTTIFLRKCFKIARYRKSRGEVELLDMADGGDDSVARLEALIRFRVALSRLPRHCQDVITTWALEGNSRLESARQLGWSRATVYRRTARCWKRFVNVL